MKKLILFTIIVFFCAICEGQLITSIQSINGSNIYSKNTNYNVYVVRIKYVGSATNRWVVKLNHYTNLVNIITFSDIYTNVVGKDHIHVLYNSKSSTGSMFVDVKLIDEK